MLLPGNAVPAAVRDYRPSDLPALRACVVELQEYERQLDPRLRPPEAMADAYCARMLGRCDEAGGRIFVAEDEGVVVGFVTALAHEPFTEPDDPPGTCALITDLVVTATHRGRGIGRQLIERAEQFVRDAGARELRIVVLAANTAARRMYASASFVPHLEVLTKRW